MSEHLDQLVESPAPFGVLYCELRNFKTVNDTHGHRAGDHVLIAFAQRLQQITRTDDVVARRGGDEFLITVTDPTLSSLERLARRAAVAVAQPISLHPSTATMTTSITVGSAVFDPDGDDTIDAVLHRADTDMYQQRNTAGDRPAETLVLRP